jgi:hypothetical protein
MDVEPVALGVPEIAPEDDSVKPAGSVVDVQVYGELPPVAANCAL